MNVKECFEEGLLKKEPKDTGKSIKSIGAARHKIEISRKTLDAGICEESVINAYSAMFHASRAILFRDGVKERSHYALYVYIKDLYKDRIEARFLSEFNRLRLERHELLYGFETSRIDKLEVKRTIQIAEEFIRTVERLLKL